MVTPIGAILRAATGDTTKSPGHGGFFLVGHRVTKVFKTAQNGHRVNKNLKQGASSVHALRYARSIFTLWSRGHAQY